jgi:hypothetical protein
LAEHKLCGTHKAEGTETLDKILCTRATKELDIEKSVEEFYEVLEEACRTSFQTSRDTQTASTHKTAPWRSDELTIMRKYLNALRCKYERRRDCEELRCQRRALYQEAKTKYAQKLKKEKANHGMSTAI